MHPIATLYSYYEAASVAYMAFSLGEPTSDSCALHCIDSRAGNEHATMPVGRADNSLLKSKFAQFLKCNGVREKFSDFAYTFVNIRFVIRRFTRTSVVSR